jgi:hypothetical protein
MHVNTGKTLIKRGIQRKNRLVGEIMTINIKDYLFGIDSIKYAER